MVTTPHILTGAAVGKMIRRPWLALAVALGSHFLLDLIPHLDTHMLYGAKVGGVTRMEALSAAVEALVGIAFVLVLVWRSPQRARLLWLAFAAIAIDFFDNVPPWGDWFDAWPGTAWLSIFHHAHQWNVGREQWVLGFGTQVVVVGAAVLLVRSGMRRGNRHGPAMPAE